MKKLTTVIFLATLCLTLFQCFDSKSDDDIDSDYIPLDRNTNVALAFCVPINQLAGGHLISFDRADTNFHFTGNLDSLSEGINNWSFTVSSFTNYSYTYTDDLGTDISVIVDGNFILSLVDNSNTSVRTHTITSLLSNIVTITYGSGTYTLDNINITFSIDYSSNNIVTITGSATINGTLVSLYYTGNNQN